MEFSVGTGVGMCCRVVCRAATLLEPGGGLSGGFSSGISVLLARIIHEADQKGNGAGDAAGSERKRLHCLVLSGPGLSQGGGSDSGDCAWTSLYIEK